MKDERHETIEQSVTDCNHLGNAAKMREAVENALDRLLLWNYTNQYTARMALGVVKKLHAAISAPPRNCDVGTAEEQVRRHLEWCERNAYKCQSTPSCAVCLAEWAQMPYEEGDEK